MKIRLMKSVVVPDSPGKTVGDVFETKYALGLIADGLAVESKDEPIQSRVETIENRDPVAKKKK